MGEQPCWGFSCVVKITEHGVKGSMVDELSGRRVRMDHVTGVFVWFDGSRDCQQEPTLLCVVKMTGNESFDSRMQRLTQ